MNKKYFVRLATTFVITSFLADSVPSIVVAEKLEETTSSLQESQTTSSSLENLRVKNPLENSEKEKMQESSIISSESTQESREATEATVSSQEQLRTPTPKADTNIDTWMPDKTLQQAVATRLGIAVEDLKQADLLNLKTLNVHNQGINSLEGLQYAENLIDLTASENNLTDITPLSGLSKLEDLKVSWNNLSDISMITTLPNLKSISASDNKIYDLPDLSSCFQLNSVVLSRNFISDISPVTTLGHACYFNFDNQILGDSGTFVVGFDQLPVTIPLPITDMYGNKLGPSGGYDGDAIDFTSTDIILKKRDLT